MIPAPELMKLMCLRIICIIHSYSRDSDAKEYNRPEGSEVLYLSQNGYGSLKSLTHFNTTLYIPIIKNIICCILQISTIEKNQKFNYSKIPSPDISKHHKNQRL